MCFFVGAVTNGKNQTRCTKMNFGIFTLGSTRTDFEQGTKGLSGVTQIVFV